MHSSLFYRDTTYTLNHRNEAIFFKDFRHKPQLFCFSVEDYSQPRRNFWNGVGDDRKSVKPRT
jgi:hypothetical protein